MRLMLGTAGKPSLLVSVQQERSPTDFDFWVVNGCWDGIFNNGHVTILGCPSGDFSDLEQTEILCDNQDSCVAIIRMCLTILTILSMLRQCPRRLNLTTWMTIFHFKESI